MSDKETLLSMGFTLPQVDKALRVTQNSGLTAALDFIDKHADETSSWWQASEELQDDEDEVGAPGGPAEPKSLTCLDCGKRFRNNALASYHGEKSGHTNFEESTEEVAPLTEEEKRVRLAQLREKMTEKKKILLRQEAEEMKQNEAIRRKGGKDAQQIKAELELKEANKEAAQRKKDKLEDAKARAAVRAQIEADKKARADKAAKEKALREGTCIPAAAPIPAVPTTKSTPSTAAAETKAYDQTRLQIRSNAGGAPLVRAFPSSETLGHVIDWAQRESGTTVNSLSSAFPRRVYSAAEFGKTLSELGLSPSVSCCGHQASSCEYTDVTVTCAVGCVDDILV